MDANEFAELPAKVRISADVVSQELEGSLVLLQTRKGAYFELDDIGARMWHLLGTTEDVASAVRGLCTEFEADEATIRQDLARLLHNLAEAELLAIERH